MPKRRFLWRSGPQDTARGAWLGGSFGPRSVGKLSPVLALLVVPGLIVAGTTLLIDLWGRRQLVGLPEGVGVFRPAEIADEAQSWLDAQW